MNRRRLSGTGFAVAGCLSLSRFVLDPGFAPRPAFDLALGVGLLALGARQLLVADADDESPVPQRALVELLLAVALLAVGVGVYAAVTG